MKISIITVSLNNRSTIEDTIRSVIGQDYPHIEYILIDGGSTDGTLDIINRYRSRIAYVVSEPDKGIYDAMNKGIALSTGDVVGTLNADDVYADSQAVRTVAEEFLSRMVDVVYADLVIVKQNDLHKTIRYYDSSKCTLDKFSFGLMPAHPTFFVKKDHYQRCGMFKTDYLIAADFELVVRFLVKYKLTFSHIPRVLVRMRAGGVSTKNFKSNWILNREIVRACRENGIRTNIFKVLSKYCTKVFQFVRRPK